MKTIEIEINDLDENARGVGRTDEGKIAFIENAKLGEVVLAKVLKEKKSFIEAIKMETISQSPFLIDNSFKESNLCGAYELYDIDYDKQVEFKKNMIINHIKRIANVDINNIDFEKAKNIYGYRNKVELKLSPEGKLSYFSRNSNQNIEIEKCIMLSDEINKVIDDLRLLIEKYHIPGYDSSSDRGVIKNIIIRSTSLGETMLIIVFKDDFDFTGFYNDIENSKIVDSFYVSKNITRRNFKIKDLVHIYGTKKIKEKLGNQIFFISPKAFMQVNREVSYKIYQDAKKLISSIKPDIILDMYSGISTTSIILSDIAKKIISVEINEDAVNDAKENAKINNANNIEWINKPAEIAVEDINTHSNNMLALFDPPRKGLEENIIDKMALLDINNIVYISCNSSTLARDIKRFNNYGYKLKYIKGYDQFVNTVHVETVCLLSRDRVKNKYFRGSVQ